MVSILLDSGITRFKLWYYLFLALVLLVSGFGITRFWLWYHLFQALVFPHPQHLVCCSLL